MDSEKLLEMLNNARKYEPMLTGYGIGVPDTDNNQEELDKGFNLLVSKIEHIGLICELLFQCKKIKNINKNHGSYGLKHTVERALGAYTSNGELTAAMIMCGFTHKPDGYYGRGKLSPNSEFNISEKSVTWLYAQDKRSSW